MRFALWGRFRIRNLKYVKECEPQQRQGFAQAPHLWKPHFRDSRNSAVSAVQYESGFRESNMPYQHCRGSDSHWNLSKTIVCERDHRANRLPYFKFRILKRPLFQLAIYRQQGHSGWGIHRGNSVMGMPEPDPAWHKVKPLH